jgi:hypothetical protein
MMRIRSQSPGVYGCGIECPKGVARRLFPLCAAVFTIIVIHAAIAEQSAFGATSANGPRASATGISGKNVELNGAPLTSGESLFPGDVVKLGPDSSAALQFGNDFVLAAPLTELVVESEGVRLRSGRLQVRASGGNAFAVSAPFFRVNVVPPVGAPASAEIRVGGMRGQVSAIAGFADVTAAGSDVPYRLHPGYVATMDAGGNAEGGDPAGAQAAGGQAAATPSAGNVSRLLPEVQIERASLQLVAAVSAPVFWNDDLHSGINGRAHIALNDGSLLNIGSSSELRIVQHDAQAQQTSLDLVIGRMRGSVVKLTRPGSRFEIRTPTGVAGLVGTDFYLFAAPDYTELIVFEGVVRFTPFGGGQAVTVTAGMKLYVPKNGTVNGPMPATPQEIQAAKDATNIPAPPIQQAAAGGMAPPVVPIVISTATGAAVVGVGLWLDTRESVSPIRP